MIITNKLHNRRGDVIGMKNSRGQTEEEYLRSYNPDKYPKPALTVDILIFTVGNREGENNRKLASKKLKVLMVKRKNHPYIGQWALPGGFVNIDEGIEEAAARELKEETGIDVHKEGVYMEQLYTWGDVHRDPRMRVVSTSYISLINREKVELSAGDDAEEARWFEVESIKKSEEKVPIDGGYMLDRVIELRLSSEGHEICSTMRISRKVKGISKSVDKKILTSQGIAFDHALIIEYGLERLRNKVQYTDIAFNLMPQFFTLTELQQVYEVILGKGLVKANFRRKIGDMVIKTDKVKKDAAHRPARLYMFNPEWDKSIFG